MSHGILARLSQYYSPCDIRTLFREKKELRKKIIGYTYTTYIEQSFIAILMSYVTFCLFLAYFSPETM